MSVLGFLFGLVVVGAVVGLVVYLTRTIVEERERETKLEAAVRALRLVGELQLELAAARKQVNELESKTSALMLKQGLAR